MKKHINRLHEVVDLVLQIEDKELRDKILLIISSIAVEVKRELAEDIKQYGNM